MQLGFLRRILTKRVSVDEPLNPELKTMLSSGRFVDDVFQPNFHGFDSDQMWIDNRAEGGSDGVYPAKLLGPDGFIEGALDLKVQCKGSSANFLDVSVTLRGKSICH